MDVEATIAALDRGELRVAEKVDGEWRVHEEAKAAILDYFRLRKLDRDHCADGRRSPSSNNQWRIAQPRGMSLPPMLILKRQPWQ